LAADGARQVGDHAYRTDGVDGEGAVKGAGDRDRSALRVPMAAGPGIAGAAAAAGENPGGPKQQECDDSPGERPEAEHAGPSSPNRSRGVFLFGRLLEGFSLGY